jgi:hypothetical protein
MVPGWDKMSPSQRQEAFLEKWASGDGIEFMNEEAKAGYQYRAGLIKDAIRIKKSPDRVPIIPLVTFAPITLGGYSAKDAMYDAKVLGKAYLDYTKEYDFDAAAPPGLVMHGPILDMLGYRLFKWPGNGVPENQGYQFVEKPYMKAEDYDHLIGDPTDYFWRVWLPRTHDALKPLAQLPPLFASMELAFSGPWYCALGAPPVVEAFRALSEAGKVGLQWAQQLDPYVRAMVGCGYPMYAGGATEAPFDVLGDSLRGTAEILMDMYRRPEKVLEAAERFVPIMIKMGVDGAMANGNPLVFIPLHKGGDGFMSDSQFKEFYWPTLKKVMLGLADHGCVPCCFAEGGYNQRLAYLAELPEGQTVWFFDRTDMAKARETLGGKTCIAGGFPVSLIVTGTPTQVEEQTKKLLSVAAGDGGYVLSIGCAMDDAREDTLKAFAQAGKKYGTY